METVLQSIYSTMFFNFSIFFHHIRTTLADWSAQKVSNIDKHCTCGKTARHGLNFFQTTAELCDVMPHARTCAQNLSLHSFKARKNVGMLCTLPTGLVQERSHTSQETMQIDSFSKRTKSTTRGPRGCWNSNKRKFLSTVDDIR